MSNKKAKSNPPLNTPEGRSKFAAESAAQAQAEGNPGQALALISPADSLGGLKNVKRRNLPQMVKPDEVPEGSAVTGEIIAIVDSPVSTIKGKLLHLKHATGREFLFPCTGVIRSALAPGIKDDEGEKLKKALQADIGKIFVAQRMPDKVSGKFKKKMFVFDVYTADKDE